MALSVTIASTVEGNEWAWTATRKEGGLFSRWTARYKKKNWESRLELHRRPSVIIQ